MKLPEVEGWTAIRQDNAFHYQDLFYEHGLTDRVTLPSPGPTYRAIPRSHGSFPTFARLSVLTLRKPAFSPLCT